MNTPALKSRCFEFYFRDVDTHVQVEMPDPETILVRASRNSFSESRKARFIRHLAAEGFIPDGCQWYPLPSGLPQIRWVMDVSWIKLSDSARARTRRVMLTLLGGGVVVWTALLSGILLTQGG